jgi:predicted porin
MKLKSILFAGGALIALASVAHAADLPTRKAAPVPEKPNCFASFWTWLDSSASDCPLSYWGVTFYGQIDVGGGYETHASRLNNARPEAVAEAVSKTSQKGAWQGVPNGLSQSNFGVKWKEQVVPDWYFIGDVNAGFDPYSLQFANGPRSLVENTSLTQINQTSNGDSSRAYGLINTRAYAGVQNKTFGTLTYGRQYAFSQDINNSLYDPFGGAYAFSLIGFSSTLGGGLGNTEISRYNNSVKYLYSDHNVRVGGMTQVGGWSAGNNAEAAYELSAGFDWNGLSVDGVYEYAKDAVALGTFGGVGGANQISPTLLKATISNQQSYQIAAKYKWDRITFYGGYQHEMLTDPSDLPVGPNIRSFNGGAQALYGSSGGNTQGIGATGAFPAPKITQVLWTGAKFAALPNVDLIFGYYHVWQKDYVGPNEVFGGAAATCRRNTTAIAGAAAAGFSPQGSNNSKCAGSEDAISGAIDWRPYKRVDVYAGAMYSKVRDGLAQGYFVSDNLAFTTGVRVGF